MNIFVEASIGAGKSSLLNNLAAKLKDCETLSAVFFKEPTEHWEEILLQFSKNPKEYAFQTQTHIMTTMHQQRIDQPAADIRIYERSFLSSQYVFQASLQQAGYLTDLECLILDNLRTTLEKNMPIPDKIIYLKLNPSISYERTKLRNNESDRLLTMEYFNMIHQKHEEMIELLIKSGQNVFTVNAEDNQEKVADKVIACIKQELLPKFKLRWKRNWNEKCKEMSNIADEGIVVIIHFNSFEKKSFADKIGKESDKDAVCN